MIIVTGGCGFIGSNFVLDWLQQSDEKIINIDKLTYAGNLANLASIAQHTNYSFVHGDINDTALIKSLLTTHQPRAVIHFAAESHVDRSITGPCDFIQTNVVGTFNLLETVKHYWTALNNDKKNQFRFLHISTDEVYGSLWSDEDAFKETTAYQPNSPYAASKASSDHFVRAYHHTYGLPTLTTNCSNNYGPYQYPEKLIPLMILHALQGKSLPIYGNGKNIRDWLYVKDHCAAIRLVLENGRCGETYNIGGANEKTNIEIVQTVCDLLDELRPQQKSYRLQMSFVPDRPGHDFRYAINADKIQQELDWRPQENFSTGLRKTVEWYLNHMEWAQAIHLKHNIL